LFKTS